MRARGNRDGHADRRSAFEAFETDVRPLRRRLRREIGIGQLLPGPPAEVRVHITDDYPFKGGGVLRTVTVPLQEGTTCPDNS
jgi:hypothetical protein